MAITLPIISEFHSKGVKEAEDKLSSLGKRAGKAFKALGLAATAAGGAVAAGLGAAVKAAVEDEQAQVKLALAIKNASGASDDQVKSIEGMISKMAPATGVADDKLRPAYQKLITATGNVERANKLLAVATDASDHRHVHSHDCRPRGAQCAARGHDGRATARDPWWMGRHHQRSRVGGRLVVAGAARRA